MEKQSPGEFVTPDQIGYGGSTASTYAEWSAAAEVQPSLPMLAALMLRCIGRCPMAANRCLLEGLTARTLTGAVTRRWSGSNSSGMFAMTLKVK